MGIVQAKISRITWSQFRAVSEAKRLQLVIDQVDKLLEKQVNIDVVNGRGR